MKGRYTIALLCGLSIILAPLAGTVAYQPAGALAANETAPGHASALVVAEAGPVDPIELGTFLDGVMSNEMENNPFPGAVISVVKDGKLFFQKGYGYADREKQTPVDPSTTIFRIGSTTKLFTWTAVMQLVEEDKLDVDKDINTYLDFKIPSTFPQPVTLKNLLTHTPGFEERNDGHFATRAEDMISLGQYLKTHIPARVFPPGKIGAYSNYGAALAGYIVERVSGMPFAEYVGKNIFTPLGMTRSTLLQPLPAALAPDLSGGYKYVEGSGEYVKVGFEYAVDYPAGGLSSTASDMAAFMLAHLQDGRLGDARILSEQTTRQMHSQLFTADPRIPGMAYGFFENSINGHRIISHGGDTLFFHSNVWLIPDQNTGIFVSTNGAGGVTVATSLIYEYMQHYYPMAPGAGPTPTPAPRTSTDFASRMKPYLGTYYPARGNFTTFEKLMEGLPPYDLSLDANGNPVLSTKGGSLQMVEAAPNLLRDPNDAANQLVLQTDEMGHAYMVSSGLWSYIRVPWYGTTGFRDSLVQFAMLLSLASLIAWGTPVIAGLRNRLRRRGKGDIGDMGDTPEPRPISQTQTQPLTRLPGLARWVGALFGPVLIAMFVGLDSLLKSKDPLFGYAVVLLDKPLTFYILMALPYVLLGLALLMLVFTLLAWIRRYWNLVSRLHYTLLAVSGLSVLWGMWYWNLLF